MSSAARVVLVALILLGLYLVVAGSASLTDIVLGAAAALATSALLSHVVVKDVGKLLQLRRLYSLVKYFIHYITVIELRAHLDVIKRALHPGMPIRPGIVASPYHVATDYALVTITNSITNTPGTVVVDVDREGRKVFIHWIDVKVLDEAGCYEMIVKRFEGYAKSIFE